MKLSRYRADSGRTAASASRLPSGDQLGRPDHTVCRATRRSTPESGSTRHSQPSSLAQAMVRPSGDQAACFSGLSAKVSWRASPPVTSRRHSCIEPPRSQAYTSERPSGDHAGPSFALVSDVRRLGCGSPTVSTHSWPSAVNATRPASGDSTGNEIPLTRRGAALSKSRRRRAAGRFAVTRTVAANGTRPTRPWSRRQWWMPPSAV